MVRVVKDKYNLWLVGYYDDFNGARAISNDDNVPDNSSQGAFSHLFTHYGNPLNGEATLNPRYRWCYYDRTTVGGYPNADEPYMFSLAINRLLHNKGAFEWISHDVIRNYPSEPQGRSQLQYPDGHTNTNKFRIHPFSGGGDDAYQMFCNGHNTLGRYIVPTGDIDSSFGRRDMNGYGATWTSKTDGKNTWVKVNEMGGSNFGNDDAITMVRRAHLAGKWMGETLKQTSSTETMPLNVFAPVESPSGMPFLCVQQYNQTGNNSTPSIPTIYYDNSLNSRDTNDILHFRLAVRSFNGGTASNGKITPKVTIKAGYTGGPAAITNGITDMEAGLTGTPKISFDLDLTGYDTNPHLYTGNTTKIAYNNDDSWIDVDVHLNYDTGKFNVYQDGNLKLSNQSMSGAVAENMYGWAIFMHPTSGDDNVTSTLMLDRVALCRPLTDDPIGRDLPPINNMRASTTINGYSYCSFELIDDADNYDETNYGFSTDNYNHNFTSMFVGNKLADWGVVFFAGAGETGNHGIARIDRPVWRGLLKSIDLKENKDGRKIQFTAYDTLTSMDKTIPMWELGQNKTNDLETFSPYWAYDAEGLMQVMDLGSSSLKQFAANVGRDSSNSFENRLDQRTQLRTGHPIQMYVNEDASGPNNIEDDFEGAGVEYFYEDSTGIRFVLTGNPNMGASGNIVIDNTGIPAYDNLTLAITAHHSIDSTGATVAYNASHAQEVLTVAKGSGTGQFPFTEQYTNSIAYIGKYIGPSVAHDDENYSFTAGHNVDIMANYNRYMTFIENNPATWENGRGSIGGLRIINAGYGYTVANNYYTLVDGVKEKKGNILLPAPVQPDPSAFPYWVGETATAEWESETTHINVGPETPTGDDTSVTWIEGRITDAIVTNGGSGYGYLNNGTSYNAMPDLTTVDRIQGTGTYNNSGATALTLNHTSNTWPVNNNHTGLNGVHIISGNSSHGAGSKMGYFNVLSGSHSSSGSGLVLKVTVNADENGATQNNSTVDIEVVAVGSGYALNDTLVATIEYFAPLPTIISLFVTVSSITQDAELEIIRAEQAYTDTLSFHMDTSQSAVLSTLSVGDEFVISGASSDYDDIRGKHTIKAIKKVLNYHGNPTAPNEKGRYLYQIQTYTPIPSGFTEGDFGDFDKKWGLMLSSYHYGALDQRLAWSKKTMATLTPKPASMTEDITSRAIHARWMRDLDDSLWFKYHFGRIGYNAQHSFNLVSAVDANANKIEVTQATYNAAPNAGVAEIVQPQPSINYETRKDLRDVFIYKCKYTEGGKWYLGACKYISISHPTTVNAWGDDSQLASQPVKINIIKHDNNYKHIWLLWADMRNDATADADGGKRKKDFGLKYPTADNYSFDIQFDDQFDEDGNPESFAELKIGEDLDVWEIDSTIDDSTGSPFSQPLDYDNMVVLTGSNFSSVGGKLSIAKTGHGLADDDYVGLINCGATYDKVHKVTVTNSDNFVLDVAYTSGFSGTIPKFFYAKTKGSSIDETYYRDWEGKGGAFVVVDTSKFFNLNTLSNKGKVGQDGGGETNLGDYYAVGVGDPVLIDSYYINAASTTATTNSNYRNHYNLDRMVANKTELASSIIKGHFWLEPTDTTIFSKHGLGRALGLTNGSNHRSTWYFLWNGKVEEDVFANTVTVASPSIGDKFWTITKSGATFISDGVVAGTYVENTSKPLVEGVGDSWKGGWKQKHYYRVKEVVSETQLKIERVIHYTPSETTRWGFEYGTTGESFSGFTHGLYVRPAGLDNDSITDGWATGNHLKIPKQLCNILVDTVNSGGTDNTWNPSGIETIFTERFKELVGTRNPIQYAHSSTDIDNNAFSVVEVYTSTANEFAYRLMMKINGKYKNTNGGTFYESDKMRTLWTNSLLRSWWADTKLTAMFDIQNVPISFDMTTYNTNSQYDSYGSMIDSNGDALMDTLKDTASNTGVGDENSLFTSFSWLVGRDNRFDFRPKYNSGYTITRDEVKISKFAMSQMERVDNVRVIYNQGMSITDYPKPNVGDTTTWKVLEHPEITNSIEALSVAKAEYNARKKNPIELDVEMLRLHADDRDAMLDGGRYGYIADAQVALQGNNDQSLGTAWCWTIMGTGGVPFSGMTNGIDGNMGAVVTKDTLHKRYGSSAPVGSGTIEHKDNYTWYGSRSVSNALQIVHVGKDAPKVSETTGEKLRVVVAIKPSQAGTTTIETTQFRVFLLDCAFATTTSSGYGPDLKSAIEGHSYLDVQYNGFYEIDVPSSYGTGKVVFSFNADYCRDLLRSRCGDPTSYPTVLRNSLTYLGDTTNKTVTLEGNNNLSSIFPLGCRKQTSMKGGFGDVRAMWYAPTLNIIDDVMYVPATYVKYTDAGFDINNKTMVITNVEWRISFGEGETVKLSLREDESNAVGSILSYVFKPVSPPSASAGDPSSTIVNVIPPSGGVGDEIKPDTPSGGNKPSDEDGYSIGYGVGLSDLPAGLYRTLMGGMDNTGSQYSSQYSNSILGQNIMPTTPSSMRGMTGALRIHPTSGSATATKNGINLPGKGKEEGVGAEAENKFSKKEIEHTAEVRLQTPPDAINDELNITADLKLPATTKQGSAVLYVQATCLETGASISEVIGVNTGSNLKNMQLCSAGILTGAGTTGNTIVVSLSRRSGVGDDTAHYTTMSVENLNINFRRAAFPAENTSNVFMPYS